MISNLFSMTAFLGILASGIRLATPYLFALLEKCSASAAGIKPWCRRSNDLGAFFAFYVAKITGKSLVGRIGCNGRWRIDGAGNGYCDN